MAGTIEQRLAALEAAVGALRSQLGSGDSTAGPTEAATTATRSSLDQADIASLADKLDTFGESLDEGERALLLGLIGAASAKIEESDQTEGVSLGTGISLVHSANLQRVGLGDALLDIGKVKTGGPAKIGGGEVQDVGVGVDVGCVHGDWTKATSPADLGDIAARTGWSSQVLANPQVGQVNAPDLGGFAPGAHG